MEPGPDYRVLSVRTIALAALVLVLVGVGVAAWLLFAYGNGSTESANRLDAIRTAGTIVVGTGGAGALWLAARRQRTSELALRQKDLDHAKVDRAFELQERTAAAAEADALERRVTDLYTKAADQLGSEKAPVRLAGMYALERLAQSTPDQRQTVVNVLCAYLRMPATLPLEEQQVRMTAQRILALHLRATDDGGGPAATHWSGIDLDLTGATLLDWQLTDCVVRSVECFGTRFTGDCAFDGTMFERAARFDGAEFGGRATFIRAIFGGVARFSTARFEEEAGFDGARFLGEAPFSATYFAMDSSFSGTRFEGDARFGSAVFARDALFSGTRFVGAVRFGGTRFEGAALFDDVTFGETRFDKAEFETLAEFKNARFGAYVEFSEAQFKGDTRFNRVLFAGSARFSTTRFTGDAQFDGAWVKLDVPDTVARAWPAGFTVVPAGPGPDEDGDWGLLTHVHRGGGGPGPAARSGVPRPPSAA